eukprot:132333-Amphidinium_carterae.1
MDADAIRGSMWQTKVERKRVGTPVVIHNVSLAGVEWMSAGWAAWQMYLSYASSSPDFLLCRVSADALHVDEPTTYS